MLVVVVVVVAVVVEVVAVRTTDAHTEGRKRKSVHMDTQRVSERHCTRRRKYSEQY